MKEGIWKIDLKEISYKSPYELMTEYAEQLADDTNGVIQGKVTELSPNTIDLNITLALNLAVHELNDYIYRLIEVSQKYTLSPYPVNVKLIGEAPGDVVIEEDIKNEDEFISVMESFIKSETTRTILKSILKQIEIRKK